MIQVQWEYTYNGEKHYLHEKVNWFIIIFERNHFSKKKRSTTISYLADIFDQETNHAEIEKWRNEELIRNQTEMVLQNIQSADGKSSHYPEA